MSRGEEAKFLKRGNIPGTFSPRRLCSASSRETSLRCTGNKTDQDLSGDLFYDWSSYFDKYTIPVYTTDRCESRSPHGETGGRYPTFMRDGGLPSLRCSGWLPALQCRPRKGLYIISCSWCVGGLTTGCVLFLSSLAHGLARGARDG